MIHCGWGKNDIIHIHMQMVNVLSREQEKNEKANWISS